MYAARRNRCAPAARRFCIRRISTRGGDNDGGDTPRLDAAKRGRKADPQAIEHARLLRETVRPKAQLERAESITEVQKKSLNYSAYPDPERRTKMIVPLNNSFPPSAC